MGQEPYAILVGGPATGSDLYASGPGGEPVVPLTYSAVSELAPALAPDGDGVAFLRALSLVDSTPATVWVMDLRSGYEREIVLPKRAGIPAAVGWSGDGSLVIRSAGGLYRAETPFQGGRAAPVPVGRRAAADSALAVLLGDPVFARVVPCDGGTALCTEGRNGATAPLVSDAHGPVRWGRDSVAFFRGSALEIRPLGPGRPRALEWRERIRHPRAVTFFSPPAQFTR
ncbi:MAG: hypothetical protein H0W67_00285 [Gemmatimonadales bacterium]|nr:hypothetical protein [Gemmatimonadales bacterium]